jgi:hypothetical protein
MFPFLSKHGFGEGADTIIVVARNPRGLRRNGMAWRQAFSDLLHYS